MPDKNDPGAAAFRRWIYGLWYPALLGTFGINLVTVPPVGQTIALPPWGWVIVLYLTLQYGEGSDTRYEYRWLDVAADLFEIAAMVLLFVALGYFLTAGPGYNWLRHPYWVRGGLVAMFAIPVMFRFADCWFGHLKPGHKAFYWSLTGLSSAAAVLGGVFVDRYCAFVLVMLLLLVYAACFIVFNHCLKDGSSYRRPPPPPCPSA